MGDAAEFYGQLHFSRRLNGSELEKLGEFIDGQGGIFFGLQISAKPKGVEPVRGDKFRGMMQAVEKLLSFGASQIPPYGFEGEIFAVTEYEPYSWYVRIGPDGKAIQVKADDLEGLLKYDKRKFLDWTLMRAKSEAMRRIAEQRQLEKLRPASPRKKSAKPSKPAP